MIHPTPGRIVWYRKAPDDPGEDPGNQPLAAMIAHVVSDELVNLTVSEVGGYTYGRQSVRLVQDGECPVGACTWMPYQKGQAAKTEQVTDKLPVEITGLRGDVDALHARLSALETAKPAEPVAAAPGQQAQGAEPQADAGAAA